MDSLINAAALALSAGDPLAALKRVALREDPPALALRGIAMAQLGDFPRARQLLARAANAFGAGETVARARCRLAEAEIALVSRDLSFPVTDLDAARATLNARGDRINAAHAAVLLARRLILTGKLDEATAMLRGAAGIALPPAPAAARALAEAGLAIRRIDSDAARHALAAGFRAARRARSPALIAEVRSVATLLKRPAARLVAADGDRLLTLAGIEAVLKGEGVIVDGLRHAVRRGPAILALASRPVLFKLVQRLAAAAPGDVPRADLIHAAFRGREADESHRARLRVEIGRLREALGQAIGKDVAIEATRAGYRLRGAAGTPVALLLPPDDAPHSAVLALLADGEAWSSSALAIALDSSPRTVQRALEVLSASGRIAAIGRGPSRRWLAQPVPGFPTSLLLPGPLMAG